MYTVLWLHREIHILLYYLYHSMYTIYLGTGIAISVIGLRGNFSKEHFLLARLQPNVNIILIGVLRVCCALHIFVQ